MNIALIALCVIACLALILSHVQEHDESGAKTLVSGLISFIAIIVLCVIGVYHQGRPRDDSRVEKEVVQEVLTTFGCEDRNYAVLRNWGSDDGPVMFEIGQPLSEETACVVFRASEEGGWAIPDIISVSCPRMQTPSAERSE